MIKKQLWMILGFAAIAFIFYGVDNSNAYSTVTVNVLVHNGEHAAGNCVKNTVACLSTSNANNLIPGVWFTWGYNAAINASTLAGYDVLVMPGGDGFGKGYYRDSTISASDIRKWVADGKGFFGTCAGAYGGVSTVFDYAPNTTKIMYYAWGLAPHVDAQAVSYNRMVTIKMTAAGQNILDYSGIIPLHYASGAAMKERRPGAKVLATYADNSNGFKGHAAIVADTYGKGRTILCGPHPESAPQQPKMVARMTAWAANALPVKLQKQAINNAQPVDTPVKTNSVIAVDLKKKS
jgi:glutamine amidotransferase-like uncharacterized protein